MLPRETNQQCGRADFVACAPPWLPRWCESVGAHVRAYSLAAGQSMRIQSAVAPASENSGRVKSQIVS